MSTAPHAGPTPVPPASHDTLELSISVSDPEVVAAVGRVPAGRRRDDFVRSALRIGILALEQAQGRVDSEVVRNEGEKLLASLAAALAGHQKEVTGQLASTLKDYFDPESGRFNERVKRLVQKDGEIEQLLRRQVGAADSEMARTLAAHLGEQSPVLKMLSPDASKGVVASLDFVVKKALDDQRERILGQFSLDNKDGALTRLVAELTGKHGQLETNLKERIDVVVKEFSLDEQDSALSRLVKRVEEAQARITSEFSLDADGSALARMRKELLGVLDAQRNASQAFQAEVKAALEGMRARKEAEQRSTTHGGTFEDAVRDQLERHCHGSGDLCKAVGAVPGLVQRSKKGDLLITLGSESRAPGAGIVVEAKESGSYRLAQVLQEMEEARKNRGCEVGLFVWSQQSAPPGTAAFTRHGNDIVVLWDAEDEASDAYLVAGLSVARALCTRGVVARERETADIQAMEKAIREIERQAGGLSQIQGSATNIQESAGKILERVRIMADGLRKQVEILDGAVSDLKGAS